MLFYIAIWGKNVAKNSKNASFALLTKLIFGIFEANFSYDTDKIYKINEHDSNLCG